MQRLQAKSELPHAKSPCLIVLILNQLNIWVETFRKQRHESFRKAIIEILCNEVFSHKNKINFSVGSLWEQFQSDPVWSLCSVRTSAIFRVFFWDSSLFSKHEIGEGATFFSAFRRYVMRLFCIALMVKHFFSNWLVICRIGSTKGERVFLFLLRCNIRYVAATCDLFFAATCDLFFFTLFLRCNIYAMSLQHATFYFYSVSLQHAAFFASHWWWNISLGCNIFGGNRCLD